MKTTRRTKTPAELRLALNGAMEALREGRQLIDQVRLGEPQLGAIREAQMAELWGKLDQAEQAVRAAEIALRVDPERE